jgi:aromatic-L-amino-acid decarboxylase
MDAVLDDFRKLIVPATTHWNHPAFMAYFANSSTGAGVLGEALTAALNVNAMLWRTSPAATELELLTLDWLRQMLGLPEKFFGVIGDTASSNTLYALAAAREMHPELRIRQDGMSGRADMPRGMVYCSEEAHSSVDKAVMTLGFGQENSDRRSVADGRQGARGGGGKRSPQWCDSFSGGRHCWHDVDDRDRSSACYCQDL